MYTNEIINFFKSQGLYDESMFFYLYSHSDMFDYREEEKRDCMGFAPHIDDFGILDRFRLCMPYAIDSRTKLIEINIITKGIVAYKYLDKPFKNDYRMEALGFLYEKLFIDASNDPELEEYGKYLESCIINGNDDKYKFALFARDYLIDEYDGDIKKMDKMSKNLSRIYRKQAKN